MPYHHAPIYRRPHYVRGQGPRRGNVAMMPVREPEGDCQYNVLRGIIESGDYAILTAWRANHPRKHNEEMNAILRGMLESYGYHPIPVVGYYEGKGEESFLVPGMALEHALAEGRTHRQESVIHGNRLIDVSNGQTILTFEPAHTIWGPKALEQKAYTRNRQGTAFSLQP